MNLTETIFMWTTRLQLFLLLILCIPIVLQVFSTAELLKHNHLIAPVFGRLCEKNLLLLILSGINDVCPFLLILCLEVAKELIEGFVALGHRANTSIQ